MSLTVTIGQKTISNETYDSIVYIAYVDPRTRISIQSKAKTDSKKPYKTKILSNQ